MIGRTSLSLMIAQNDDEEYPRVAPFDWGPRDDRGFPREDGALSRLRLPRAASHKWSVGSFAERSAAGSSYAETRSRLLEPPRSTPVAPRAVDAEADDKSRALEWFAPHLVGVRSKRNRGYRPPGRGRGAEGGAHLQLKADSLRRPARARVDGPRGSRPGARRGSALGTTSPRKWPLRRASRTPP